MLAVEAKRFKQLVAVLLGEGDGDAVVVVLHQLLPQEDERLGCGKKADMFEVNDARQLLDELVGCLLLANELSSRRRSREQQVDGLPTHTDQISVVEDAAGTGLHPDVVAKVWVQRAGHTKPC